MYKNVVPQDIALQRLQRYIGHLSNKTAKIYISRLASAQAIVATAHMIARIGYQMLKFKVEYQAIGADEYEQRFREHEIRYLQHKAARLGLVLSPPMPSLQADS